MPTFVTYLLIHYCFDIFYQYYETVIRADDQDLHDQKIATLLLELWRNMVGQDYGTTGLRKNSQGEIVQVINKHVIVSLVYITLVLDNILLTVVGKCTQDSI